MTALTKKTLYVRPLWQFLQSLDRYQVLGLSLDRIRLLEGDRDTLDEVERAAGVPRTITAALGAELSEPDQTVASNRMTNDALLKPAWTVLEPRYEARLTKLTLDFEQAQANGCGSDDLPQIATAAASGRVATLFIGAERRIAGRLDEGTGEMNVGALDKPGVDNVLDNLGELVGKIGGRGLGHPGREDAHGQRPGRDLSILTEPQKGTDS